MRHFVIQNAVRHDPASTKGKAMDTYEHINLPIDEDYDDLGNERNWPLASDTKRHIIMNQDFTNVPATNAPSARPTIRRKSRKSRKGPALLLLALTSAVGYVNFAH